MKIVNWNQLDNLEQQKMLARPHQENLAETQAKIRTIIDTVRTQGDAALFDYTAQFDKAKLTTLTTSAEEFKQAEKLVTQEFKDSIEFAMQNIQTYHQAQIPQKVCVATRAGVVCERQSRPIQAVGLYVPGGSAPLVSTLMMLAIPAKLAACPLRILCTPPTANGTIDPHILVTAQACNIDKIYKVGGAQAIAAMAYGTETVPKVDKIFGPGNTWVTQAKLICAMDPNGASLDLPAGPSELVVIADAQANPVFVSADLLSQAEHGSDSQVILITDSQVLLENTMAEIQRQLETLPRRAIATESLQHARFILVDNIEQAIQINNRYAPEHLSLQVVNPEQYIEQVTAAGAVFVGPWAAETLGDYITGSNHVLPTGGYARSYSGLGVSDFMKFISFQTVSQQGLQLVGPYAETIAVIEGLDAHKRAATLRLDSN